MTSHPGADDTQDVRPATPAEAADVRACTRRPAWPGTRPPSGTRAGSTRPSRSSGGGGSNLFPVEQDADRRPPRALPAGRSTSSARGPGHALAVEPGRGRGGRGGLQPPDAGARRTPVRGDRRAGPLGGGGRARRAARPRRDGGPPVHRARSDHLAPGPRRLGRRAAPAAGPPWSPRDLRRPPGGVAVRRRTRTATGSLTDYDYFGGPEASRGWAPAYIDRLRSRTTSSTGSSPVRGRWARSSPRCWVPACGLSESPSTPWTGGPATATCAPRSGAGSRSRSRWWRRVATHPAPDAVPTRPRLRRPRGA